MSASRTTAVILYLTFYILLSLLCVLWLLSVLLRYFQVFPYETASLRPAGPVDAAGSTNVEVERGLDPSVIETFPKFAYSESSAKTDVGAKIISSECVVCLGMYEENEMLRLLPKCGHVFHVACVDTWIRSHATCPFCRANLSAAHVEVAIDGDESIR